MPRGPEDPQLRDRYGLNFRINDPPLLLGEAQFFWNAKKGDPGLDGKFKLGGWRHLGNFSDQRFGASGMTLADPALGDTPATLSGDFGVYSVFEQKLYRVGRDDDRGIGVFARASYSPPDRNLIDFYADAGLEFIGLSERRPKDKFGVAAAYALVSPRVRALDGDFQKAFGPAWTARSFESLVTAVYQYEVRAGWTLQPNFQYIIHPGGGATNLCVPRTSSELMTGWNRLSWRGGRPQIDTELRELIRRMSVENPLWGAPRICGELLKLGFRVAQSSVAKYMVKRRGPPSLGWGTFRRVGHTGSVMNDDVPFVVAFLLVALIIAIGKIV
jgi:hypothetical protein